MYIDGTESYPWDVVLPLAGLQLEADTVQTARIGIQTGEQDTTGARIVAVTPGSAAADAGVEPDDVLLSVGDVQIHDRSFGAEFRRRYADDAEGSPLTFVVRRGEEVLELEGELRFVERVGYEIVEIPDAGSKAVAIRKGIIGG
jgi:S1-C subfamily serine protease